MKSTSIALTAFGTLVTIWLVKRSRSKGCAGTLLLASVLGSCSGPWKRGEPWNFALTRDIVDRAELASSAPPCETPIRGGVDELWIFALVFLPTAIDLALLPVTGVHDVWVD
jgi:hypothetical protein